MTKPAIASQARMPFLRRRLSQNTMMAATKPAAIAICVSATWRVPQKMSTGAMLHQTAGSTTVVGGGVASAVSSDGAA